MGAILGCILVAGGRMLGRRVPDSLYKASYIDQSRPLNDPKGYSQFKVVPLSKMIQNWFHLGPFQVGQINICMASQFVEAQENWKINPRSCFLAKILIFLCCVQNKVTRGVGSDKEHWQVSSFQGESQPVLSTGLVLPNAMVFLKVKFEDSQSLIFHLCPVGLTVFF